MFQIEPILWLQSLETPPLTALLSVVTLLGYVPVYVTLLLMMAFAYRLRPSLAVLGGVLLCGLLVEGFKDGVAYPRPDEVDDRVRPTFATTPIELAERGGARSFWSPPKASAIAAVRRRAAGNYGFPSGHVGAATAFLLCSAFFFRSRRPALFAAVWVPLMAVSRMYLGRHFLGDVLGGLAIGLVSTGAAVLLLRAFDERLFGSREAGARRVMLPLVLVSLTLLAVTPFQPLLEPEYVGGFAGLVVSYAFLLATGLPRDGGTLVQRGLRVALAALLFGGGLVVTRVLVHVATPAARRLVPLAAAVVVSTATFAGTVRLSRRLGLYETETH